MMKPATPEPRRLPFLTLRVGPRDAAVTRRIFVGGKVVEVRR